MRADNRVREIVLPIVQAAELDLYDLEHESGLLRIVLDQPGGIDVETLGNLARLISAALDEHDPIPDAKYLLEVTSPGIERRLRTPRHFQQQLGQEISVKLHQKVEGTRRLEGVLLRADEECFELSTTASRSEPVCRFAYRDVETARTIFRWNEHSSEQGSGSKSTVGSANRTPLDESPMKKKASAR